jgi:uncharacterized membrane protein YfcA
MVHHLLLILAGVAGGFCNTFAAGGSIVQIPVLVGLGLHPMIANTTNHVPVLVGFAVAVWRFHRQKTMPWGVGFKISIPMVMGSVLGALTASIINDRMTVYVLFAALLLAMALMLAKPDRWLRNGEGDESLNLSPRLYFLSLLVGFWTGLIVVGSGVFLLLTLVLIANCRVTQANAVKVLSLGIAGLLAVIVFAIKGQIVWSAAIPVSIGSVIGSLIAAKLVMRPNAGKWVYALILLTLGTEIVRIGYKLIH